MSIHRFVALFAIVAAGCQSPPATQPLLACGGMMDQTRGPYRAWFEDVTGSAGLDVTALPWAGAAVADVDGDGLLDVATADGGNGSVRLFRNRGELRFEEQRSAAALPAAIGAVFSDLDNDGDPDLILFGATLNIFENRGQWQLVDRSTGLGPPPSAPPIPPTTTNVLAADFDGDGLVDLLFVGLYTDRLFRNLGGFAFADVTAASGLRFLPSRQWSATAFDYDGDGALDLWVGTDAGVSDADLPDHPPPRGAAGAPADKLFHNASRPGAIAFTETTLAMHLDQPRSSMGAAVADFDGDAQLDLYVGNVGRKTLLLNQGAGGFVDDTARFGVSETRIANERCLPDTTALLCLLSSWGMARFDIDHDGLDDLVLANQAVEGAFEQPASVLQGRADGTFAPVHTDLGCMGALTLQAADLDGDGDLDLLLSTAQGPFRVFRNRADPRDGWLRVRLSGSRSNREGIGAIVVGIFASGRRVMRPIGAGGGVMSEPLAEAHFTSGADRLVALDVRWPSGAQQHVEPVALGQLLTIAEP